MNKVLNVITVGLCAGLLGTTALAANSADITSQLTAANQVATNAVPATLDHSMMLAHWHGGGGWHGGGWHGGGWHGGWHGGGWGWGGGWNNAGWVVPAVAATALTAAAISSQNRYYYGDGGVYSCRAYFRGYMYQGTYRPGGLCYINVGGEIIGVGGYSR